MEILDEVELKFLVALVMMTKNPKVAALLATTLEKDSVMEKPQISEPQFSFLYGVVYEGGEPGPAGVFAEVFSHKLNKSQAEGLADIAVDTDDIDAAGQIVYHLYDK